MDWYWWVALGIVAILVLRRMTRRPERQPVAKPDEFAFLEKYRKQHADADREMAKVVDVIAALPIAAAARAGGNVLTRAQLAKTVENFLQSKILLEWNTSTKMVHVVMAPGKVTVFAKLEPTEPAAAMRTFTRVGEDAWAFETRQVGDMQQAIVEADKEAASSS